MVLVAPWLVRLPRVVVGFLFLSLIAGQLIRLPLPGQGGGLLLSDLASAAVVFGAFPLLISGSPVVRRLLLVVLPFILWSLLTLVVQFPSLGASNTLIAASYWVRLTVLLLLLPALTFIFRSSSWRQYAWRGFYITVVVLALLGVVQIILLPSLSPFSSAGWDPHQFRLVSTWIDPNFFGAFLAMGLMAIILGPGLKIYQRIIFALIITCALFATQSRGAFLSMILSLLFTAPLFFVFLASRFSTRRLQFLVGLLSMFVLLAALVIVILLPRFVGLVSIDPTVQARITNIQGSFFVIKEHSLMGVGYNAYQFASREDGAVGNFQNHSRAGTDNSLLTIWATTGLVGLMLFLVPWVYIAHQLFLDLRRFKGLVSFLGLFCMSVLFINSQFVNSLIYSHLLITLILVVSLSLSTVDAKQGQLLEKSK